MSNSKLFMKTSQVLRDTTILELQKQNDFLRHIINNKLSVSNTTVGKRVRVLPFRLAPENQEITEVSDGYLLQDFNTNYRTKVMIIGTDGIGRVYTVPYQYILFPDGEKTFN